MLSTLWNHTDVPGSPVLLSVLLFPLAEPSHHSAPAMKLVNAAGFFALVPTVVLALEPITTSLAIGGGAIATWQLLSQNSWLKCRFWKCCNVKDSLDIPGNGNGKLWGGLSQWALLSAEMGGHKRGAPGYFFMATDPLMGEISITARRLANWQRLVWFSFMMYSCLSCSFWCCSHYCSIWALSQDSSSNDWHWSCVSSLSSPRVEAKGREWFFICFILSITPSTHAPSSHTHMNVTVCLYWKREGQRNEEGEEVSEAFVTWGAHSTVSN